MNEETVQLIAAAIVTLTQLYMVEPWKFPVFAYFWDTVAKFCGGLANILAYVSMKARLNYYAAISETA